MRRSALVPVVLVVCLLAPGARAATPDLPLRDGDFSGSVGVGGGRTIFLECFGEGPAPTVVLDSGLRNGASIWDRLEPGAKGPSVLAGLSRFVRVCAYDRPGTIVNFEPLEFSRSSPAPMPRTTTAAADDTYRVLKAAGVPGPYVLVSHSTGGLIDRRFAAAHPRQVAGLVLVDALAEFMQAKMNRAQLGAYEALNNGPVEGIVYPDLERIRFRRSFAEMRRAAKERPLAGMPVSVLSHGKPFGLPGALPGGLSSSVIERAWTFSQNRLAALTPGATHIIARRSSHYIQLTEPELVIEQVKSVVRAAREMGLPGGP